MSMVLTTRSPLEVIGMNGAGTQKRRSARLSQEGNGESEPPSKKAKINETTTTINTKQQDGEGKAASKKKSRVYDRTEDDFVFTKKKRGGKEKETKQPAVRNSTDDKRLAEPEPAPSTSNDVPVPPAEEPAPKTAQKKTRKRLPTTPERDGPQKQIRRSNRLSNEKEPEPEAAPKSSPHKAAHAKSHANTSPSPEKARPVTVEKKRKHGANGVEEQKTLTIALPFADTPVMRRNKEMRKNSAESHRRSSAGMRGKRASSLIDEGRGHEAFKALPHGEVPTSEFFKHISADLTEPRRMRCLLGWCGTRSLPPKPPPPDQNSSASKLEFQALQAAHIIQEELSQDLVTKGTLSDWFSRDEDAPPQIPLRKKPNPRNITNAAKAEELERELERLKQERAEWDEVIQSASSASQPQDREEVAPGSVSPLRQDDLDSPQRAIFEQLQSSAADSTTEPQALQQRLRTISDNLEFAVDQFAHGVHALSTTRETAARVAEKSLANAANALDEREKQRSAGGRGADQMDTLRGLARVLNAQYR
ncbi:hypothetical protein PRZ48_000654 [Zasmidium cellare]|uniref:Uncharacterized protein n=1 Tax=Zasmidium cellare TaxID=395010 RepID=A0ABR0F0K3_ZASCE|nr:hypothetical protein PRZ48_000654 [Zasmidium cellare]